MVSNPPTSGESTEMANLRQVGSLLGDTGTLANQRESHELSVCLPACLSIHNFLYSKGEQGSL